MYDLRPGDPERFGEFRVVGRLGGGGMGTVFLGESPEGTTVAIKVVHEYLATDPEFRRRFAHEVEAAGKISGTYTAEVITADTEARLPWMATEFVEGQNLLQTVDSDGPLSPEAVLELAAGVADALAEIHRAGVIHRDLKPSNILLSPQGPRVIDFGIARAAEASTVTSTGKITGSAAYMSPEQAIGQRVGPATDVFSLGALLYYAAVGEPAFGTGPATAMLYRTVHGEVDLSPIWSEPLRDLIAACLEKDPENRPNAKHVAIAARTGQPVTRLPRATPPTGFDSAPAGGPSAYDSLMSQVAHATASRGNPIIQPQQYEGLRPKRSPLVLQAAAGGALLIALVIGGVVVLNQGGGDKEAPAASVSNQEEQSADLSVTDAPALKKTKSSATVNGTVVPAAPGPGQPTVPGAVPDTTTRPGTRPTGSATSTKPTTRPTTSTSGDDDGNVPVPPGDDTDTAEPPVETTSTTSNAPDPDPGTTKTKDPDPPTTTTSPPDSPTTSTGAEPTGGVEQ